MFFRSLSAVLINVTPFVCFVRQEQKKTFFKQKHILERGWLDNRTKHLGNAESKFIIETSDQLNGVCKGKQQRKQQSTCSLKKIYDILKIQISEKITLWCNFFSDHNLSKNVECAYAYDAAYHKSKWEEGLCLNIRHFSRSRDFQKSVNTDSWVTTNIA